MPDFIEGARYKVYSLPARFYKDGGSQKAVNF